MNEWCFMSNSISLQKNINSPKPSELPQPKLFSCCHPIYSGRQAFGLTSRGHTGRELGGSHRIFIHIPSAVLARIFLARRILPFLSLVDREVEFCVHLLGLFVFFVRKNPSSCDDTETRTQVPTSEGFEVTN